MSEFELNGARPRMVSISLKAMKDIISLLEHELTEGEFETDAEISMVKALLDECRRARESAGQIVWHKWPEEKPPVKGRFLVTEKIKNEMLFVSMRIFDPEGKHNPPWGFLLGGIEAIAWAEMPEPYKPKETK